MQLHAYDDEPSVEARRMAPGGETTIQDTTGIYYGIVDRQGANHDYSDASKTNTKSIHPKDCAELITPKIKLQAQWRRRRRGKTRTDLEKNMLKMRKN